MNILVLTSQENFVWHSMQEIIPYLEKTWQACADEKYEVQILNVDEHNLSEMLPIILKANYVVLTCFNLKLCKMAFIIREHLKLPVNFYIHVHNMATIAFWPFKNWASEDFFKKNDVFVTSCLNDQSTIQAVFKNPKTLLLPFYLLEQEKSQNIKKSQNSFFVYIGRISTQKNLHNLILGYSLALRKNPSLGKLIFYGKEDNLGSPNMNLKSSGYQKYLENLVARLNLHERIEFRGHVKRAEINNFLQNNNCITVSCSLHSDENFGMAVLQSLCLGNNVLISDWGGHSDFKKYFPNQVELLAVEKSIWGPSLSAQLISEELVKINFRPLVETVEIHPDYELLQQVKIIKASLIQNFSSENLESTEISQNIYSKRKYFSKNPENQTQVFDSYQDLNFHQISSHYIGAKTPRLPNYARWSLVPWVTYENDSFKIEDPHKGHSLIKNTNSVSSRKIYSGAIEINCSEDIFNQLLTGSYLFGDN